MALTNQKCRLFLESLRWNGKPICPYCGSDRATALEKESRYHCNYCSTSYSVTVNTLFHHSHIELKRWFRAIYLVCSSPSKISVRHLAKEISVTKSTASSMLRKIRNSQKKDNDFLEEIAYFYQKDVSNNN